MIVLVLLGIIMITILVMIMITVMVMIMITVMVMIMVMVMVLVMISCTMAHDELGTRRASLVSPQDPIQQHQLQNAIYITGYSVVSMVLCLMVQIREHTCT